MKTSSESFFQQKKLIKNVLAGKKIHCHQCQTLLVVDTNEKEQCSQIRCANNCTDIILQHG